MDYYNILGVNKSASPEEIKRAYRKLAMQHHPDRGGDANKLKQINEAYAILKDPVKRQQYDNPQPRFDTRGMNSGMPGFDDIFEQMFRQRRPQQQRQNRNIQIGVRITLDEALTGKQIIAGYKLFSGREETVDLNIPAGVNTGDVIKFIGLGDDSFPGQRGTLFVQIQVLPHKKFTRQNDNLVLQCNINALDLITGSTYIVETLEKNKIQLKIPAGTQNGTKFSVKGYGMPNRTTQRRGNLFIEVIADIPKIINDKHIKQLGKIRNEVDSRT